MKEILPSAQRERDRNSSASPAQAHPRNSPQVGWTTRFDPGLLTILALPWVILRFDSSWLFGYAASASGFIDPWVYFGFFLDLTQHIRTFKGAYFTTRLTWTVPGAAVYHVFPPIAATYVLHLALFYGATISLYLILRKTVNRRAAFLATTMMAFHSYFLWSIGWPYIDGAANTYLLLTMGALMLASRSTRAGRWLVAAGALAAMTIYCQLFLIVFSPVVLGYYYFARRQTGHARSSADWKPLAWGFAGITLLFGTFNMAVNGRFLFFINSVGTAAKLVVNHNPYNDSTYRWLAGPMWLVLPAVALVGALACLSKRKAISATPNGEFILFWQRYYVLTVAIMVFWQLAGQPVLQLPSYASYLMPAAFLALGSQLAVATNVLGRVQFAVLCACVVFLSWMSIVWPMESSLVSGLRQHAILASFTLGAVGALTIARQIQHATGFAVVVVALSLAALNLATSTRGWDHAGLPNDPASQKAALLAIVDSVRSVQSLDAKDNLYFWYDANSRLGKLYRAVASTYLWAYRLESETFPVLGSKLPPTGRRILVLAEDGEEALRQAEHALAQAGLGSKYIASRTIHEGPFAWNMIEIEVTSGAEP